VFEYILRTLVNERRANGSLATGSSHDSRAVDLVDVPRRIGRMELRWIAEARLPDSGRDPDTFEGSTGGDLSDWIREKRALHCEITIKQAPPP
jgi:hypothetical protein